MLTQDALKYGIHKSQQKPGDKKIVRVEQGHTVVYEDGSKRELNANEGMIDKPAKPIIDTADTEDAVIAKIDLEDMNFNELKKFAKSKGIEFSRKYKKHDLIKLIKEAN
jgi:hypothetical protein